MAQSLFDALVPFMELDSGDSGGSFWSTFNGGSVLAPLTSLEQLLESPDVSIEAVLNEEEVIQEFKSGNDRLLKAICTADACKKLVEFITCEPPEGASHERKFRYPFVSVELMTSNSEFSQFFMEPGNTELQEVLWNFLESTRREDVNPVLAGYFARVVTVLVNKHMKEAVAYLRERGVDALLERFLERLHSRSLAELFARLVCQEESSQLIFPVEGLIVRLLSRLQDHGPMSDTQENVTLVILELLAQRDNLCFGDELLRQLTSPQAIRLLVEHVLSGSAHNVAAAASILSSTILHSHVTTKDCSTPSNCTMSPLPPLLGAMRSGEDDDMVRTDMEDPLDSVDGAGEAALARTSARSFTPRSPNNTHSRSPVSYSNDGPGAGMMRELCLHFPRIRSLLDDALSRGVEEKPLPGVVRAPAVGGSTLEMMNLLNMLVRTGCEEIFEAIEKEQLLPRCLEIFFRYPWSSLLHNSVRLMLSEVLSSTDGVRPRLVLRLIDQGGLVQRLVNEYREDDEHHKGKRKRHTRVGYMGHLYHMCSELRDFGNSCAECGQALDAVEGWQDVVLKAIDAYAKIIGEELGGGIPEGSAGLASSGTISSKMISKTEEDFVLDDLEDAEDGDLPAALRPTNPKEEDSRPTRGNFGNSSDMTSSGFDSDFNPYSSSTFPPNGQNSGFAGFDSGSDNPWVASFDADFSQAPPPVVETKENIVASTWETAPWPTPPETTATDFASFPPPTLTPSDTQALLNALNGNVTAASTSSVAPLTLDDSSWNAFGSGSPHVASQWPPPVSAPTVGTSANDNLFGLIEVGALSPSMPESLSVFPPSIAPSNSPSTPQSSSLWPKTGDTSSTQGWADFGGSTSSTNTEVADPFGTVVPPAVANDKATSNAVADWSWVAEFDPVSSAQPPAMTESLQGSWP